MTEVVPKMSPISLDVAQQFVTAVEKFVLCNGTPEDIEFDSAGVGLRDQKYGGAHTGCMLSFGGMRIRVPATDKVVPIHPRAQAGDKSFDTFHSMQRADGSYVPGTLVVWQIQEPNDLGVLAVIWDPKTALRNVLRIDKKTGQFSGPYAAKGLRILPNDPTEEQIEQMKAESRTNWEEFVYVNDVETVRKYYSRVEQARASGAPLPEMYEYIRRAKARVDQLGKRREDELAIALGTPVPEPPAERKQDRDDLLERLVSVLEQKQAPQVLKGGDPAPDPPKRGRGRPPKKES